MASFMYVSLVLCLAGVPLFGTAQYLTTGNPADPLLAAAGWLYLAIAYWWPLGWWLFRPTQRVRRHLLYGYLISVPLYIAGLAVSYAAIGYRFAPRTAGTWWTYLSASPWFYLYVVLLWWFVNRPGTRRTVAVWLGTAAAVLGIAAPVAARFAVDDFAPRSSIPVTRIANVRVVDPIDGLSPTLKTVVLDRGRIIRIEDSGTELSEAPGGVLDGHGAFLVPGLIDVHAHLQTPAPSIGSFSIRYAGRAIFGHYADHRLQYLANGITSVRDLGGAASVSRDLRDSLRAGHLAGPRLFTVGRLITSPAGHPVSTIWPASLAVGGAIQASHGEEMLDALDKDLATFQPDAVKVIYGTIGRARTHLTEDLLTAAIAAARRHNLPAIVHAETTDDVRAAVHAGATGIEHVASIDALPGDLLRQLASSKPFVDLTFGEYRVLLRQNRLAPSAVEEAIARARTIAGRLAHSGVPIVAGTDAPLVPYGTGLHDELRQLEHAGLSREAIFRVVTVNNAAYLNRAASLGRIAPGFRADLVLVAHNPLEGIETLRHPLWTMVDGVVMWETSSVSR